MSERLLVGRIKRAHGVRGALFVESVSDAPGAVFAPGRVVLGGTRDGARIDDTPWRIAGARVVHGGVLVTLAGLADREAAQAWKGRTLFANADELPPPADDEVYVHDLIGLDVFRFDGTPVGPVVDVYEAPQGLLIEVDTPAGRRLVPWREELIIEADHEAGRVRLADVQGLVD